MESNISKRTEIESRRVNWTYLETSDLLDICLAKNVGKLMAMKKCNKKALFNEIGREMSRLGHGKSLEQVIVKFKNLCQKYKKGLPNNPTGQLNRKRFELWSRMHEIFKYRAMFRQKKEESATPSQVNNKSIPSESATGFNSFLEGNVNPNDPLMEYEEGRDNKEDLQARINEPLLNSSCPVIPKQEINSEDDIDLKFMKKPPTSSKSDRSTANYLRCVRYLVDKFKSAQEDLQNKFYNQQLRLQQQQQEWEEKILDEEREFFAKVLKTSDANAKRKNPHNDVPSEDDFGM